jgi:hypothetical protein
MLGLGPGAWSAGMSLRPRVGGRRDVATPPSDGAGRGMGADAAGSVAQTGTKRSTRMSTPAAAAHGSLVHPGEPALGLGWQDAGVAQAGQVEVGRPPEHLRGRSRRVGSGRRRSSSGASRPRGAGQIEVQRPVVSPAAAQDRAVAESRSAVAAEPAAAAAMPAPGPRRRPGAARRECVVIEPTVRPSSGIRRWPPA